MDTFWLLGREARVPLSKANSKSFNWIAPAASAASAEPTKVPTGIPKQMSVASEDSSGLVKGISKLCAIKNEILRRLSLGLLAG